MPHHILDSNRRRPGIQLTNVVEQIVPGPYSGFLFQSYSPPSIAVPLRITVFMSVTVWAGNTISARWEPVRNNWVSAKWPPL
jgi:hypothetical protein